MTTLCNNCGNTLASDIDFCPRCGVPTPSYYSRSSSSQADPTAVPSSADTIYQKPPIYYSSSRYGTPDRNPYGTIPPPPPRSRSGLIIGIISGIVVSILILGGIGTFAWLTSGGRSSSVNSTSSPPVPTAPATPSQVVRQGCGGAFSDEFNSNLQSGWNWVDPSAHATYNVTAQAFLTISTVDDASDLNPATNFNAPRLLQPITGNFTIQTSVELPSDQQAGFQAAGLLIWQDNSNFIRVERYPNSISFEQVVNGVATHDAPQSLASSTIMGSRFELQVRKNADLFTASWRKPGQVWQDINTANIHLQTTMVGLDLISQGAPKTTAYYEYFRVSCA